MGICAGNPCFSSGQRPSEASDVGSDVHLFVGTQKRASSVAFEAVLPAPQLTAFNMVVLAPCVYCLHGSVGPPSSLQCSMPWLMARPQVGIWFSFVFFNCCLYRAAAVAVCLLSSVCFCDQPCYHKMKLKHANTPLNALDVGLKYLHIGCSQYVCMIGWGLYLPVACM